MEEHLLTPFYRNDVGMPWTAPSYQMAQVLMPRNPDDNVVGPDKNPDCVFPLHSAFMLQALFGAEILKAPWDVMKSRAAGGKSLG